MPLIFTCEINAFLEENVAVMPLGPIAGEISGYLRVIYDYFTECRRRALWILPITAGKLGPGDNYFALVWMMSPPKR